MRFVIATLTVLLFSSASGANEFSFTFDWGDIKKCTTGNPNRVANPIFTLVNVPEGTTEIKFRLTDLDVRSYNHGGGKVEYTGENVIQPGAFKYKSPCPPNGQHTYQWKASLKDADGNKLGTAKAEKIYPE